MKVYRLLALLAGVAFIAACDSTWLTGSRATAKPCITDTTYWRYLYSPIGRIVDSVHVSVRVQTCGRR